MVDNFKDSNAKVNCFESCVVEIAISFRILVLAVMQIYEKSNALLYCKSCSNGKHFVCLSCISTIKVSSPVVNTFLFYESRAVKSGCKIKQFKGFTLEWGRFILENRDNEHFKHPYDIVIGPVADEVVQRKVEEHKQTYGEDYLSDEAVRNFINEVSQFTVKYIQYCFCSELSLEQLIKE